MHLTSEDKRAARDGFAYVVLVGGKRKCYCTKHSEAKAEAGKSGKIVSLGRMRYTTQNPRKRSNPKRRYVVAYGGGDTAPLGAFSSKAEAKAAMLDKVARGKLVGGYVTLEKPKYRNPWEAKRPATRYGVTVTNPRKYKHGKAAQLERLILRVSAHGKLTETQLQEILQGIRRAYPAGSKATAQKRIVGLIAKAKEQRIWPKVYNRLARL